MTGEEYISELHLKQQEFTYSASGPFTKHRERIQKLWETGNLKHLCRINKTKIALLMMQYILILNIKLKELFQISVQKIKLVKMLEIVNMMDIKEH